MQKLTTVDEVIEALGGIIAVAKLVGVDSKAVKHWPRRGLPSKTFIALSDALKAKGMVAPPSLWHMKQLAS